ncbi:MAG: hypothetical protein Q8Q31_00590 [Nanoarchaeota archaeon]|nr:hypothetical protein [Nanoarchaeota archaeon]
MIERTPTVIMHPFFPKRVIPYMLGMWPNIGEHLRTYAENMKVFLSTFEGPIITLESSLILERTQAVFQVYGRSHKNTTFIPTHRWGPLPLKGWQELYNALQPFNSQEVNVAGGYLDGVNKDLGCLGFTIRNLKNRKLSVRILEGLTY